MSFKLLFALSAMLDLEIEQMDVTTAFLYGKIKEDIYIEQPTGFINNSNKCCKLKKALYGLKQSPRVWYETLSVFLQELGFKPLESDYSVFINNTENIIIAIYVDDILIFGKDKNLINKLKANLSNKFRISDLGPIHHYLGMEILRNRAKNLIYINQETYLTNVLLRFNMSTCNSVSTPMETGLNLQVSNIQASSASIQLYQSVIGSLMYAMLETRPDICYCIAKLSQYASNPNISHFQALKRVLRYIQGTLKYRLIYKNYNNSPLTLEGFSDANWGGDTNKKSTGAYLYYINNNLISWCSKKQPTVALSSCESEYMALTQASREAVWLIKLISQLKCEYIKYTQINIPIHLDSQSAIALAKNPEFHARTKYIDIQNHYVRELVIKRLNNTPYISTNNMKADGLTKPLARIKFIDFLHMINMPYQIDLKSLL